MLRTNTSINSSINETKIVIDFDRVDGGGSYSDNFDVKFQVICWRSGHYLSAKMIAVDCASKADY